LKLMKTGQGDEWRSGRFVSQARAAGGKAASRSVAVLRRV
jgi:hypothetical protein